MPLEEDELRSMRSASPQSAIADSLFSSQSTVDTVALNKITALEDELARLRDQIAKIVTTGTGPPGTSGTNKNRWIEKSSFSRSSYSYQKCLI